MANIELKEIDINKLIPYENNAKEHPEWQVQQIVNSIKEFGFNDPIGINEHFEIIEGHGRYLAAKKLNMGKVPCILLKGMSEDEERAYIIAHNKLTINTGFNLEILKYELNALKVEEYDLTLTGFTDEEIINLENDIPDEIEIPDDEEEITGEKSTLCTLKFGKISCKLTDEEMEKLTNKYEEYVENNGTDYGFVTALFEELGE